MQVGIEKNYEILCKTFDIKAKEKLEVLYCLDTCGVLRFLGLHIQILLFMQALQLINEIF